MIGLTSYTEKPFHRRRPGLMQGAEMPGLSSGFAVLAVRGDQGEEPCYCA